MDISNIIEEWYEDSGGTGLPEVSAEDNGDVLTVVDGEWDKATPSGGGLVINIDFETGALNKTWQEIYDAMKDGNMAVIFSELEEDGQIVSRDVDIIKYATLDTTVIPNEYKIETGNAYYFKTNSPDGYPVSSE